MLRDCFKNNVGPSAAVCRGLALRVIRAGPPEFAGFQPAGAPRPREAVWAEIEDGGAWRSWRLGGEIFFFPGPKLPHSRK